jgi:hypothetical protein
MEPDLKPDLELDGTFVGNLELDGDLHIADAGFDAAGTTDVIIGT